MTEEIRRQPPERQRASIVLFSGDMDKVFAALTIATGAAAAGMDTTIFFTFWGLNAIRKSKRTGQSLLPRLFGLVNPGGIERLQPSRFRMLGLGRLLFEKMMRDKGVSPLSEMTKTALELGVRFLACETSMTIMEIRREDLIDAVSDVVGVATYVKDASESQITLFV